MNHRCFDLCPIIWGAVNHRICLSSDHGPRLAIEFTLDVVLQPVNGTSRCVWCSTLFRSSVLTFVLRAIILPTFCSSTVAGGYHYLFRLTLWKRFFEFALGPFFLSNFLCCSRSTSALVITASKQGGCILSFVFYDSRCHVFPILREAEVSFILWYSILLASH